VTANEKFSGEGIVTLADQNYFPGLMLLHRSVQEASPVPIACFDAGLTDDQKAYISGKCPELSVLPLPDTGLLPLIQRTFEAAAPLAKANKRVWPLWSCPVLIANAPFERAFWFDCDVVVLRNLDQLFRFLDDGPVFTPDNLAPGLVPNKPALYELLPIGRPFDPLEPRVNAGISGWDLIRDRAVLEAYIYPIRRACEHARIREAISWHDQGALIWAIQTTGMESCVLKSTIWNLCVIHTSLGESPVAWDDDFLAKVRARVPDANILHWNGMRVPWLV